eukprot:1157262-Pelagomonas_calceolata.AAC.7
MGPGEVHQQLHKTSLASCTGVKGEGRVGRGTWVMGRAPSLESTVMLVDADRFDAKDTGAFTLTLSSKGTRKEQARSRQQIGCNQGHAGRDPTLSPDYAQKLGHAQGASQEQAYA